MKSSKTFTILFWINSSRAKNNLAEIYVRITVDGKKANISLKRKVNVDQWNNAKKRVNGSSAKARQINSYIDETYTQLFQIYQDLKFKGELITAQIIKSYFNGEHSEQGKTLKDIMTYHSSKIENTLAPGTIRNFGITENYIFKFLNTKKKTSNIYIKQLNYEFLTDFEIYLSNLWPVGHPKALSHNTIMKHIQRFRKIVTLAYHMEWIEKDPFVRWKMTFEKTNREFLSDQELKLLEDKVFVSDRLDRVRDLFVFSCYTGISYVDIMNLTSDHIVLGIDGGKWIMTKRQKTNSTIKIPLLPQALEIVTKYKDHPMSAVTESLLPKISNEKLNCYLKEVANFVGIHKNLTFHMARHTFATTITLSNGMPIETVSKLLGHSKISTTQIYARVLEHKVSNDMNTLRDILNNNQEQNRLKRTGEKI